MSEHIQHVNKAITHELDLMGKTNPEKPFLTSLLSLIEAYTNKKPHDEQLQDTGVRGSSRYKTVIINGILVGQLRREKELTQAEMAELMKPPISRGYVSVIEKKENAKVSITTANALAIALTKNIRDLVVKPTQ